MTRSITFTQEFTYPGQPRATLTVEIVPPTGAPVELRVVLDTGAAISRFDHAYAARMGISDVRSSPRTFDARAVDNEVATGYIHDVLMNFLGRNLTIPVAFIPDWPTGCDNLLGMKGFFEHGIFAFEHVRQSVYIRV